MAYRKTEKVLAQLEAKRAGIIAAAIDVIAKVGMDGLTTDMVADRAGIASGLIYKYFADKTELMAAVVALLLARDLAAIREAIDGNRRGVKAVEIAIRTYTERAVSNYSVIGQIATQALYREGIKREFKSLLQAAGLSGRPFIFDSVVVGAIWEAAGTIGSKGEDDLVAALLRAIGVREMAVSY